MEVPLAVYIVSPLLRVFPQNQILLINKNHTHLNKIQKIIQKIWQKKQDQQLIKDGILYPVLLQPARISKPLDPNLKIPNKEHVLGIPCFLQIITVYKAVWIFLPLKPGQAKMVLFFSISSFHNVYFFSILEISYYIIYYFLIYSSNCFPKLTNKVNFLKKLYLSLMYQLLYKVFLEFTFRSS